MVRGIGDIAIVGIGSVAEPGSRHLFADDGNVSSLVQPRQGSMQARYRSRAGMALAAAVEAIEALSPGNRQSDEIGLVVGTTMGAQPEITAFETEIARQGMALASPGIFPFTVHNAPAGIAALSMTLRGPNVTLMQGAGSALAAIATAAELVVGGACDQILAGGVEVVDDETEHGALLCVLVLLMSGKAVSRPAPDGSLVRLGAFGLGPGTVDGEAHRRPHGRADRPVFTATACVGALPWLVSPAAGEERALAAIDAEQTVRLVVAGDR